MMKWVKHDVKNRRKIFQDLFSLLKLGDLSLEFLKETVRIEPLVKKSDKCNDSLIDELFSRASLKAEEKPKAEQPLALPVSKDDEEGSSVIGGASGYGTASSRPANGAESQSSSQTTSGLRIINEQPSGGGMRWSRSGESLPGFERWRTYVITYSFPAGSLMGVSYEAQEFTEYLPWNGNGDECDNLLRQAFDAGLIFKIQEVDDRKGKIVWNDEFPHKTNKTGGSENNGYPDPNHPMKLREALRVKGFERDYSIPVR
uniref:E3 ubiquitin-protein ligase DTX3L-like n=1 Tax=Styela clava TaxID=7725 RepID=UPI00193A9081|nr:E3 ubiquitin-protein ligase DTX3L-like [Styela clava]